MLCSFILLHAAIPVQVKEMEAMFSETIGRLTSRVQSLEKGKGQGQVASTCASSGVGAAPGWQQRLQGLGKSGGGGGEQLPPIPKGPKGSNQFVRNVQLGNGGVAATNSSSKNSALHYLAESKAVLRSGSSNGSSSHAEGGRKTGGGGGLW